MLEKKQAEKKKKNSKNQHQKFFIHFAQVLK